MDAYDVARFWAKVNVSDQSECWEWMGARSDGYGDFKRNGESVSAHRVAFELFSGPIPDGALIRHTCDNRPCCNPFHMLTGTDADNVRDRVLRDRGAKGESNGRHILTEDEVVAILADKRTHAAVGAHYGVSKWTIQSIRQGRTWRHVKRIGGPGGT